MPIDPGDSRTACWYAGSSCSGYGGQEGEQFKVTGTIVAGELIHGGFEPGGHPPRYEPGASPPPVRGFAERAPPPKNPAAGRGGAQGGAGPPPLGDPPPARP